MTIANWVFEKCSKFIEAGCKSLSTRIKEHRTIYTENRPYLTRHYLKSHRPHGEEKIVDGDDNVKFGLYLHYFHRGDEDAALHNHPFKWSYSLILTNGYSEERWDAKAQKIITRLLRPGSINRIMADDFHRVDLIDPTRGAWTLFLSGPRINDAWGFWWPGVHEFIHWREFTRSNTHEQRPS